MTVRAALLPLVLAVAAAGQASAQTAGPTGSLTLMSRPAGASFRIEGDLVMVGRTPVTFTRGLSGRFRVSGSEIGYQRWRRAFEFDGLSADTVWMVLRRKNAFMAGARSLVLPGWGQFYDDHPMRGVAFLFGGITVGAGFAVAESRYRDRLDESKAADAAYLANQNSSTLAAQQSASHRADNAKEWRQILLGGAAAIVGLSVIDAVVAVPRPVGTILLGAVPGDSNAAQRGLPAAGPRFAMTLARVTF